MKSNTVRAIRLFLAGLLLISASGCDMMKKGATVKYPNQVTSEMQTSFDQAENSFQAENYAAATTAYQNFLQTYPYNRLSDQAEFRLGQIEMLDRKYNEALARFDRLMSKTPDPAVASRAAVKAGICQYRLKNDRGALVYFDKVEGQYIRGHDQIKTAGLALAVTKKLGLGIERQSYYYALLVDGYEGMSEAEIKKRYADEAPPLAVARDELAAWSKIPASPGQIDKRFSSYEGRSSAPYINAKLGYKKKKETGKQYKIGVILPLSGKYESYGVNTLNGMECAIGAKPGCNGVKNIQLVTRDDGGSPASAVTAVQELAETEGVTVIVGPLSSASALAAAQKAQELGVVMISLAQKEGIPQVGSDIFRFSLTPYEQVRSLLAYATKRKAVKSFGVFYPNTNYGKVFLDEFQKTAPSYGAEVTASAAFNNSKEVGDGLRNLKFSVAKISPESPVGFNALFIPDSYLSVLNILPQLQLSGMGGLLLLGTNAWNDPNIASASQGALNNAVFLDIYFKDSQNPRVKNFIREYQAAFGQAPATLEAMGYDVIRFISETLARGKIKGREEFKQAVAGMKDYQGVTGLKSFGSDREAQVQPYLLSIQGGSITEVSQ